MQTIDYSVALANSGDDLHIPEQLLERVSITRVPEDFFWAEAMHTAAEVSWDGKNHSHVLWLNDDVELEPSSVKKLLEHATAFEADIVVGQTISKEGILTYGGYRKRSKFRPLDFERVIANSHPIKPETFNGNVVLIGPKALSALGPFPSGFKHFLADIVYGLDASRVGLSLLVAPGFAGTCQPNNEVNPALDIRRRRRERLRSVNSPKGIPLRQQWRFSMGYGGLLGPIYFLASYSRFFITLIRYRSN
jgi:GT2 family glycosyltransferase